MKKTPPFQTVIDALLDPKPFPAHFLRAFSDLEPERLQLLLEAWPQVSPRRKQTLLEDLQDLAESDTLTSFDDLARALLDDPDSTVRVLATRLLWECGDRRLIPLFMKALRTDVSSEVRAASASALGLFVYLGELEEIPAQTLREVEDALLEAAASAESKLVRLRALEALGFSSRPEVPPLLEAAVHETDPDWVASALFAMGRSADERWEKDILSRLRSPNDEIRREAVRAAGEMMLPAAREPLLDLLEDEEDADARRDAVRSLARIGGEGVRERLQELLDAEPDDEEADFLLEALDELAVSEALGKFEMFDFEPDEDRRGKEKDALD